jgi:hypothetical protein
LVAETRNDCILFRNDLIRHERWADLAIFAGDCIGGKVGSVPSLENMVILNGTPVICLDRLVSFQLSRWLLDDQVDLRDLIGVGLLDGKWADRVPPALARRLIQLLEDPDG